MHSGIFLLNITKKRKQQNTTKITVNVNQDVLSFPLYWKSSSMWSNQTYLLTRTLDKTLHSPPWVTQFYNQDYSWWTGY